MSTKMEEQMLKNFSRKLKTKLKTSSAYRSRRKLEILSCDRSESTFPNRNHLVAGLSTAPSTDVDWKRKLMNALSPEHARHTSTNLSLQHIVEGLVFQDWSWWLLVTQWPHTTASDVPQLAEFNFQSTVLKWFLTYYYLYATSSHVFKALHWLVLLILKL